jgi:hypothetical protein
MLQGFFFSRTVYSGGVSKVVSMSSKPVIFDVEVAHAIAQDEDDCTMWVAVCDGLHVVTEAETYEGLVHRVWEIAPEMAQENGLNIAPDALRLRFIRVERLLQLLAM